MNIETMELALKVVLFVLLLTMFGFFAKYMYDYNVLSLFLAKVKGDVYEYDRIRRAQMKRDLEERKGILNATLAKNSSVPILSKIYKRIEMTGIREKFPAFSELYFMIAVVIVGIIFFIVMYLILNPLVAIFSLAVFFFLVWYTMGLIVYNRKVSVDSQLLLFTNSTASASRQYSSIIDIIGAIYDQFTGPFREALEACYVEAKTANDSDLAFTHLKEKFDSVQLSFIIDNMVMCSASTGDYYTVATDLSKTVAIYEASHEKKKTTLRNAKINVTVMFIVAIAILFLLGGFFESGIMEIISTTLGSILTVALVAIYVFGLNMRAD